jgi:pyruvate/2-oxoglutarate dehydrogenase complex dihydrolipoamide dehydrogenase (E3) component
MDRAPIGYVPKDMTPTPKKWDAIVIGSGQAGSPLARKLAKAGWRTAIIEMEHVGGTCINVGCTPTKTMIADAKVAQTVREAPGRGIHTGSLSIDLGPILRRKNNIVESFRSGTEKGLTGTDNLTLIMGSATFCGPKTISVGEDTHTAEHFFINTGCSPSIPTIEGLDTVPYLTSTTLLDIPVIPAHLVVLGGGYIALEMGQLFRRLGSEVSIIERSKALLSREDEDIQRSVREILEGEGMHIHLDAEVAKVSGAVSVHLRDGSSIEGSHLLVAVGRSPRSAALQLDRTGVETDARGFIKVDERLQTNVPGIYALGDVKGGPAFTHISYNDYIIVAGNLLENKSLSTKDRMVPYCMFTDPQLGRIGLSEREALEKGLSVRTAVLPMTRVARAVETGRTKGLMKAVVDTGTKMILGAAVLGEEGGEIMTILQMAMQGGITYEQIKDMVFAHPLYAESLNNLFMQWDR